MTDEESTEIDKYSMQLCKPDSKRYALKFNIQPFNPTSNDKKGEEDAEKFRNLLFRLNKIPIVFTLFKITADSVVAINYDYSSSSIYKMRPSKRKTLGLCLPHQKILFVGAGDSDEETMDTIVHELTHLAVQIVYENDCNPFYVFDEDRMKEYKNVIKVSNKESDFDEIPFAYGYEKSLQGSELIVAIFTAYAKYYENSEKLKEFNETFEELKKYFEDVKEDFDNFNPEMRMKIRNLNNDFGVASAINLKFKRVQSHVKINSSQVLISKVPKLTLASVHQQLAKYFDTMLDAFCLFVDLTKLQNNSKLAENYKNIMKNSKCIKRVIALIPNDMKDLKETKDKFLNYQTTFTLIVCNEKFYNNLENNLQEIDVKINVQHKWDDLNSDSKIKILNGNIKFQNSSLKLSELIDFKNSSEIFDENFINCCLSENLEVNVWSKLEKFHISRELVMKWREKTNELITIEKYLELENKGFNVTKIKDIEDTKCEVEKIEEKQSEKFSEDKILECCQGFKNVLVSDVAGSGKSRILMRIRDYLVEEYPQCWIQLIDLQNFIKEFSKIKEDVDFVDFFTSYLMKDPKDDRFFKYYEKSIFKYCYKFKKVFILFDGFDEISPECEKEVLTLIKAFKGNSGSQIFISTRNHLEINLMEELTCEKAFTICPMTNENKQKEFLILHWKDSGILSEELPTFANELIKKLSPIMKNSESNLIGIPQKLKIAAEAVIDSTNEKINEDFLENFTNFSMYKRVIKKLQEEWLKKGGPLAMKANLDASESGSNFNIMHMFLAMKSYFEGYDDFCGLTLDPVWTREEITRCGIIRHFDGKNSTFLHETFKEAFAAIFILHCLKKSENWRYFDEVFKYLNKFLCESRFKIVRMFINEGFKDFVITNKKVEIFAKLVKKILISEDNILDLPASEGCDHIVEFIMKTFLQLDSYDLIKKVLNKNVIFLYKFKNDTGNILLKVTRLEKISTLEVILKFAKEFLSSQDYESLVLSQSEIRKLGFLHIGALISFDAYEKLLTVLKKRCDDECFKKLLISHSKYDRSPLFLLAQNSTDQQKFEKYWSYLEILSPDEYKKLVHAIDFDKLNIFQLSVISKNIEAFNFLVKNIKPNLYILRAPFKTPYLKSRNCFHSLAWISDEKFHEIFWERLNEMYDKHKLEEAVNDADNHFNNMLYTLVSFGSKISMDASFNALRKIFGDETFRKFLDQKGNHKRNILQKACDRVERDAEDIKFLLKFCHKFYGSEFTSLLTEKDDSGDNLLHIIVLGSNFKVFKVFMQFLCDPDNNLSDQLKPLLQSTGFRDMNLLQHALRPVYKKRCMETYKELWSLFKENLANDLVKQINHKSIKNNLLHIAVRFAEIEFCKFTWDKIKEILPTRNAQKAYLNQSGFKNQNLYDNSLYNGYFEVSNWITDIMNEYHENNPV